MAVTVDALAGDVLEVELIDSESPDGLREVSAPVADGIWHDRAVPPMTRTVIALSNAASLSATWPASSLT